MKIFNVMFISLLTVSLAHCANDFKALNILADVGKVAAAKNLCKSVSVAAMYSINPMAAMFFERTFGAIKQFRREKALKDIVTAISDTAKMTAAENLFNGIGAEARMQNVRYRISMDPERFYSVGKFRINSKKINNFLNC